MIKNLFNLLSILLATYSFSALAQANNSSNQLAIQKLLVNEAYRQGVDPALALAIAKVESNFNANALSKAGAKGVMQIMPKTAETVFGIASSQLYDAKVNIHVGISFIKRLLKRYDQRLDIALSHYNGGSKVKDKYGRLSVIPATKTYVNKVLAAKNIFTYKDYAAFNEHYPQVISSAKKAQPTKRYYIDSTFEQSLYQKVEKLRNLRLHNIMRNTQGKNTLVSAPSSESPSHSRTKKVFFVKQSAIPLSKKHKKVLAWEAIFD